MGWTSLAFISPACAPSLAHAPFLTCTGSLSSALVRLFHTPVRSFESRPFSIVRALCVPVQLLEPSVPLFDCSSPSRSFDYPNPPRLFNCSCPPCPRLSIQVSPRMQKQVLLARSSVQVLHAPIKSFKSRPVRLFESRSIVRMLCAHSIIQFLRACSIVCVLRALV